MPLPMVASPLAPTFNGQRVRDFQFYKSNSGSAILGPVNPGANLDNAFTRAGMDTKLFGEHTGISLAGPEINCPMPIAQSNVPYWFLTQKQNPWYMAPGWDLTRRKIDTKFYAGSAGHYVGTFGKNPWDRRYGHINGESITRNLAVVRAKQMSAISYI